MLTIKMLLPTLDNQVGILIDDRLNLLQVISLSHFIVTVQR